MRLLCLIGIHDYARTGQCNRCGKWQAGHPIISPPPADFNQVMEAELEMVEARRRAAAFMSSWPDPLPPDPPQPAPNRKRYRSIDDE